MVVVPEGSTVILPDGSRARPLGPDSYSLPSGQIMQRSHGDTYTVTPDAGAVSGQAHEFLKRQGGTSDLTDEIQRIRDGDSRSGIDYNGNPWTYQDGLYINFGTGETKGYTE